MKKVIKSIFQYVGAILLAIVIAALLRFFIVDFYSIPSDSMYPTIEPGDFIVVNKMYMGARFYKNFDFLDGAHPETVRTPGFSSLKRNDVIVFNFPTHTNGRWDMDLGTFYVKRCIALPGDTLSIIKGINHVNGKTGFGNVEEQQRLHHYHGEYAPGIYNAFPFDYWHRWNIQDFGPLYLPAAGTTILLDTKFLALSSPDRLRNPSSSTLATTPTLHPRLLDPGIHVPKKLVLRGRRSSLQLQRFSLYRSYSRRLYRG